jgi:hypothetical protein
MASILIPNQGAVMLWQTFRSTAVRLSIALAHSFRRLTAHKDQPILRAASAAGIDAEKIKAGLPMMLPKNPAAQKPEKAASA